MKTRITEQQRQAMVAWKRIHGARWREHLTCAFNDNEYPGIAVKYAETLKALRNTGFGARQLRHLTLEPSK